MQTSSSHHHACFFFCGRQLQEQDSRWSSQDNGVCCNISHTWSIEKVPMGDTRWTSRLCMPHRQHDLPHQTDCHHEQQRVQRRCSLAAHHLLRSLRRFPTPSARYIREQRPTHGKNIGEVSGYPKQKNSEILGDSATGYIVPRIGRKKTIRRWDPHA